MIPFGSAGDVYPFVALGAALQRRGHRITMISSAYFADVAEKVGFEFAPCLSSEDYLALIGDPDFWHPVRSARLLVTRSINPAISVVYEEIKRAYRPGESAVVAGTLALGARVAQDKLGLPLTTVHLQPIAIRSSHEPAVYPGLGWLQYLPVAWRPTVYNMIDAVADRIYAGPLNKFRGELGLPPIKRIFGAWWHSPESTLALFPGWYAAPQPDWPAHISVCDFPLYDGGNLEHEPDLKDYLEAGEKPLVFTSGSAMTSANEFFAASAAACSLLGRRAIFVTKFPEQLPNPLPPWVRHVHYAPFSKLLPSAAALVHHGGIGTAAQALKAGIPQLVAPCCYDQFDNAAHLSNLGVGVTIPRGQYDSATVASALGKLLADPMVRERCREARSKFGSEDALAPAVDALEQYWYERRNFVRPLPRAHGSGPTIKGESLSLAG
jgi:UDP:flavonoid glycosyltransferase YjiC (YdhE family)